MRTALAIAVLAIAIGANTAVFSVLNALLLRALPFQESGRLGAIRVFAPPGLSNEGAFHRWRQTSAYAEDAASFTTAEVNLEGVSQPGRTRLTETSWNLFSLLGIQPFVGRGFLPGEDKRGSDAVALIGYGLWHQQFGGNQDAIGSTIRINGATLTIVGVAPPGFNYPQKTAVWSPTAFDVRRIPKTDTTFWSTVVRLRSGLTWRQARDAFENEAFHADPERRAMGGANRPALVPLRQQIAGPILNASLVLMAAVVLLLLLACSNIANFLLSGTLSRVDELSIRTALGATRARLVRQLLSETVLLSLASTVAGLLLAMWVSRIAAADQPSLVGQGYSVMDWRVLMFAAALTLVTGVIFGLGAVTYVSRKCITAGARSTTPSRRRMQARHALITVQVAVTIVLATASIALGRSFIRLQNLDNGYDLRPIATLAVSFAGTPYHNGAGALNYYREVTGKLRQVSGVVSVSATQSLPLTDDRYSGNRFTLDDNGARTQTTIVRIGPSYISTMGGRVVAGREFTEQDMYGTEPLVVVNEEFARSFADPSTVVGRYVTAANLEPRKIVGVVRGMRDRGPTSEPRPQVFWPIQAPRSLMFVVRVAGNAKDHIAVIRDVAASVDRRVPIFDAKTMDERLTEALVLPKFYTTAVVFFGCLALLVSVTGIYGSISSACDERMRELGIRLALGTTPTHLRSWLLARAALTSAVGATFGLLLVATAEQYLGSLIRGADVDIVVTFLTALVGTVAVAAAATWVATRRVAQLDVMVVLRPDDGA